MAAKVTKYRKMALS